MPSVATWHNFFSVQRTFYCINFSEFLAIIMEVVSKIDWRFDGPTSIFEWLGMLATGYVTLEFVLMPLFGFLSKMFEPSPKKVVVGLQREELEDVLVEGYERFDPKRLEEESRKSCEEQKVYKWDPSTLQYFGEMPATTKDEVDKAVARARIAQNTWKQSSFKTVSPYVQFFSLLFSEVLSSIHLITTA